MEGTGALLKDERDGNEAVYRALQHNYTGHDHIQHDHGTGRQFNCKYGQSGMAAGNRSKNGYTVTEEEMKQLIVLMGVLPIMLIFLFQYALDQRNNDNISRFQEYVYQAKEQAKQEGCFTQEIQDEMIGKIENSFNVSEEEILVDMETVPQYRTSVFDQREMIHYKVSVPIDKLMAGNRFFGISDDENCGMYTIESWTASERLRE